MNSNAQSTTTSGISFLGMLTVLFIGLKLTGYITWSWWWVLSPIWIPWLLLMAVAVCVFIYIWYKNRYR